MTYAERMMARPLMTTFGGTCCRPSALRSRLSTTTILVNDVTMTATNGAIARPTTVTMTRAGLKLLKSIGLPALELHAERVADGDDATAADAAAVGANADARGVEVVDEVEHVARFELREFGQRQLELAEREIDAHGQLGERIGGWRVGATR